MPTLTDDSLRTGECLEWDWTPALQQQAARMVREYSAKLPRDPREALAYALKQNGLRRRRTNTHGEIFPGIWNDQQWADSRVEMLEEINQRLGSEVALSCSWLLSSTGYVPSPCGVPAHKQDVGQVNDATARAFDAIAAVTKYMYSLPKAKDFSVSIPKQSTMAFEQYLTGNEGLLHRAMYLLSYALFSDQIKDLAAAEDWWTLGSVGKDGRLPMHIMMSVNYRMQPRQAKELEFDSSGRLKNVVWKQREVKDAAGVYRIMDFATPLKGWGGTSMRGRSINQCSGSSGMYLGIHQYRHRKPIYSHCGVFEFANPREIIRRCRKDFEEVADDDFSFDSWDFSAMEASNDSVAFENSTVKGWKEAGRPEWEINYARAVHYSPYLLTDDDPRREPPLPVQLKGRLATPSMENDLGTRSGEDDTDLGNKGRGLPIYGQGIFDVGGFGPQANYHRTFRSFFEEFGDKFIMQGRRVPGAHYAIGGNCGDDCFTYGRKEYAHRLNEWFKQLAPRFSIAKEFDTQFLGWRIFTDGRIAYPYEGKALSNKCSPERFCTSPMRRDTWPLGCEGWYQHYSECPLFPELLSAADKVMSRNYGTTIMQLARSAKLAGGSAVPTSMMDALFLNDPSVILWGRVKESDLNKEVVQFGRFYLTANPSLVSKIIGDS